MATRQDIAALLAVACPHCGATAGEVCSVRDPRNDAHRGTRRWKPILITTLDAGCHDARWKLALGRTAPVLGASVPTPHDDPENAGEGNLVPSRGLVAVGGGDWVW